MESKEDEKAESELPKDWKPTPLYDFDKPINSSDFRGTDLSAISPEVLIAVSKDAADHQDYKLAIKFGYWAAESRTDQYYDLACYTALSGENDEAYYWLQQAAIAHELEIDRPDNDQDLIALRREPRWVEFLEWLRKCKAYHNAQAKPMTTLIVPRGYRISEDSPLVTVVWFHEKESCPLDFVNPYQGISLAQDFANQLNIAFVGVSGTIRKSQFSYNWADRVKQDMARVNAALDEVKTKVKIKQDGLIAMGFSEGAQVAFVLAAHHPEVFAGAIVLSPESKQETIGQIGEVNPLMKKRGFVFGCGDQESSDNLKKFEGEHKWAKDAGADVRKILYPGQSRHAPPRNFAAEFPKWIKFIQIAQRG